MASGRPASLNQASTRPLGQSTRTRPKDWTAQPSNTQTLRRWRCSSHWPCWRCSWPLSWADHSPSASLTQRTWTSTASAGGNLALHPRLSAGKGKLSFLGAIELTFFFLSRTSDCALGSNKCPEHDCLKARNGRSFCTWQSYWQDIIVSANALYLLFREKL